MTELRFSEEQALLANNARDWLRTRSPLDAVRKAMASPFGYDEAAFREVAEMGWLGVAVPSAYGGEGLSPGVLVSLSEPMGRHLYTSPFLATTLTSQLLTLAGDDVQRKAWLPRLAAGDVIGTVALIDEEGSWDIEHPALRARADGAGYRLEGSKAFVLDAAAADLLIVSARLDDGRPALFLVERHALPTEALQRELLVDEARRSYRLCLDGVELAEADRLDAAEAAAALAHVRRVGTLLLAAEMAGGCQGSMELTLDYLKTRTQFGKSIGSYQALKHPMVDILIALEQSRSLLYHAATVFEGDEVTADIAVRMAKAHAGEAFTYAVDRSIQFHGAIGFTYECHAQLYFRRAQWAECQFGDAAHHRRQLEELVLVK